MKRNLDTVRRLLANFEDAPAGEPTMTFAGEFDNTVVELIAHVELLIDAGLLEGEAHPDPSMDGGGYFVVTKVTWSGHDFISASRSDDVWNATKRRIGQVGGWTFGLVLEVLKDEAKRRIGLTIEP